MAVSARIRFSARMAVFCPLVGQLLLFSFAIQSSAGELE